jgi:hypothetical protein
MVSSFEWNTREGYQTGNQRAKISFICSDNSKKTKACNDS